MDGSCQKIYLNYVFNRVEHQFDLSIQNFERQNKTFNFIQVKSVVNEIYTFFKSDQKLGMFTVKRKQD